MNKMLRDLPECNGKRQEREDPADELTLFFASTLANASEDKERKQNKEYH